MKRVYATIENVTPLLMNRFTDASAEAIKKGTSSAIRSRQALEPREIAEVKIHKDSQGTICLPNSYLFRSIIEAGHFIKSGKSKLTTQKSSIIPAGLSIIELMVPMKKKDGSEITWDVDERSVVNPSTQGRMISYRPCFPDWKSSFTIEYDESLFSEILVKELLEYAGSRVGIGDFRPSRKGPFGKFITKKWSTKEK